VESTEQTRPRWRWGTYRWLIILVIVANVFAVKAFSPVKPHIQLPAEAVAGPVTLPLIGDLYLTNTMIATLIADLLLILIAFSVWRVTRGGAMILSGVPQIFEMIVEAIYNLTESTARKWADTVFPWVATIILMVLLINWSELIPGVDSIGMLHEPHHGTPAYETQELFAIGDFHVTTITGEIETEVVSDSDSHDSEEDIGEGLGFTPYVRVASTDLNFTLALALTSVIVIQILGFRAVGITYLKKYLNFGRLGKLLFREKISPFDLIFPFTDIYVGLLELIAEIAKIISFSFRLFGNIFAGSVLLFIIGTLVPVVIQSGIVFLELFVGLVQAMVFGMLVMVFMTMATIAHDGH